MKMKVFYFSALALTCAVSNLQAQIGGQFRAGLNIANVSTTNDGRVNEANALNSFQVGVIGDLPLAGSLLSLQPGILFTGKGSKTEAGTENSSFYSKATSNPKYIEVPINLVAKLPIGTGSKLFIGGGVYGAIGVSGKTTIENKTPLTSNKIEEEIKFSNDDPSTLNYEEGAGFGILKRFDYGLNGTAGIEGKSIVLGVNYGLGLAKLQSGSNNSENNNNKHRVLSFTLGFKF
jgi:hypothetical protein